MQLLFKKILDDFYEINVIFYIFNICDDFKSFYKLLKRTAIKFQFNAKH